MNADGNVRVCVNTRAYAGTSDLKRFAAINRSPNYYQLRDTGQRLIAMCHARRRCRRIIVIIIIIIVRRIAEETKPSQQYLAASDLSRSFRRS